MKKLILAAVLAATLVPTAVMARPAPRPEPPKPQCALVPKPLCPTR